LTRIAILDYGMGNLRSVGKALEHVGAEPFLTSEHARVREAQGIVLPGVGARRGGDAEGDGARA
jgi:glutamine amidotransferase